MPTETKPADEAARWWTDLAANTRSMRKRWAEA
jgi:hypothetical protein